MAQDRAQVAITPFLALCKSATSPRAASDLITQATNASATYTFAELLAQPNIAALKTDSQYAAYHNLLETFAWGTWETYRETRRSMKLSDAQVHKLRMLSLLSYATEKTPDLSYNTLCRRLQLTSAVDLENLVTTAIYADLLTGTLNPATQLVQITSVAPVRDLAPGSVKDMLQELEQWSARCDSVLLELEAEIAKVKADASIRAAKQAATEEQIAAAAEANEKSGLPGASTRGGLHGGSVSRLAKPSRKDQVTVDDEDLPADEDAMELDGQPGGGKKKPVAGFLGRLKGK